MPLRLDLAVVPLDIASTMDQLAGVLDAHNHASEHVARKDDDVTLLEYQTVGNERAVASWNICIKCMYSASDYMSSMSHAQRMTLVFCPHIISMIYLKKYISSSHHG